MSPTSSGERLAMAALVGVTAVWGSTFFLIHDLVQTLPVLDFLAVRFAIAAVVMVAAFGSQVRALSRDDLRHGAILGLLYAVAQILQTQGLATTPASVSGFVTGAYVILTPIFAAVLLRTRIGRWTWIAVAMATVGLGLLSLRGGLSIGRGESLTLLAAAIYALHIIGLGRWSRAATAIGLATVQAVVIAAISLVAALPGGIAVPHTAAHWMALLYMAVIAGAGALWAQTYGQAHLDATRAAIVMTLEPAFAAAFAVALGGEHLTARMVAGGAMILAAMYVVELAGRRGGPSVIGDRPAEALHHEGL